LAAAALSAEIAEILVGEIARDSERERVRQEGMFAGSVDEWTEDQWYRLSLFRELLIYALIVIYNVS
jgi:hypothetical protein